ncbi:hypothetical protein TNCV_4627881 [Trichonephila clavipes]|nr:hypothetical protein TNCV_4627881 [Trichonephila clavipes]
MSKTMNALDVHRHPAPLKTLKSLLRLNGETSKGGQGLPPLFPLSRSFWVRILEVFKCTALLRYEGTLNSHQAVSMSSPGFEPRPFGIEVSVINHYYTGWATGGVY